MNSMLLTYEFVLLSYDLDGNLLSNRTLFSESFTDNVGGNMFMKIGNGGQTYIAFDLYEREFFTSDICVQAYYLSGTGPGFTLTIPMIVAIGSTVVIIGVIVSILRKKRNV